MEAQNSQDEVKGLDRLSVRLRRDVLPVIRRLPAYGKLILSLLGEATLPARDRTALLVALGYQVSPIDLIPGFIPVIGQLDDLYVVLWGIRRALDGLTAERATELLANAGLTRTQVDADFAMAGNAVRDLLSRGASAVGRGMLALLRAGLSAGAYSGYLIYYLLRRRTTGSRV